MRPLGELAAGSSRSYRIEVGGLRSLDLLGGEVEVWVQALRRERVEDERAYRLPELASDLYNRDLVTYMLSAAVSSTSLADLARAQNLMLRRLRADWSVAVRDSGNPYRRDLRNGTRQTALGDLVVSVSRAGAGASQIFRTLVPRIEDLEILQREHP